MATAFRIHEDIDNVLDLNKENNLIGMKNNGNDKEKRPTLAVLNNITFDGRAHASKTAFNVAAKKPNQIQNENNVPETFFPNNKLKNAENKVPVDQFKAFSVFEENRIDKENVHFINGDNIKEEISIDEADCSVASINLSVASTQRLPLQEIPQDALLETPLCVRELLSPMSVDKSVIDDAAASGTSCTTTNSMNGTQLTKAEAVEKQKTQIERCFELEEYRDDILEYMKEAEQQHRPKHMYMRKQPDINHSMRTILIDWLVEVCEEYRLQSETLCLAISYIDRFLSVMSVVRAKLQLVGTAAMFIAAKYEEIYPPDVGEFVYITDNTYTKKQVLRMEQLILKVLTFDLCVPTFSTFLTAYSIINDLPAEIKNMAQFFCELSLLEAEPYLQYLPSALSAASIALARYNCELPIWTRKLEQLTGYRIEEITEIIMHLGKSHMAAGLLPQQAIQEKYKNSKYSEVSLRDPLDIDEQSLALAIQQSNLDVDATNECNENVRKMISTLLYV